MFQRPERPVQTAETVTSAKAYEDWRNDWMDYAKTLDAGWYSACRWFADADVPVTCGDAPPEVSDLPAAAPPR
ncbi:hypothetical protein [Sphingomonas japonica]|uniref:Membrane protein n=1 Tax=Sphingomonas japonica TaxID=511662 RepID=A0ABX0U2Y3_9SPHN|nr:hypothetical protein [Sphingomonas japonica]NIJ24849.1 putative membrane protein [Sphingomonas japonica]